jgi:crossover junction endodeoxyribonuclease RuvC
MTTGAAARRVLGIDPGLAVTGYGVVEELSDRSGSGRLIASGTIRSKASVPRAERLARIFDGVSALIDEHGPRELAIEQSFVSHNAKSALALGEARSAAMVAAAKAGLRVTEFAPTEIKESVTGWGGAPKEQVQQMVMLQLGLDELPSPHDAADAIAVALTRLAAARFEDATAR